ncbi:hypothetical protein BLNAU_7923 [Blattamonas nauphoetae]|uniref:Uncharacterized protein n=1 Tax=Blattamonas nauphoetae TaxID=2049346 RepID=A0ABQ9Y021_9EUKA|nr:hypothetical protein BLNAU_7923 [Blattamonas nauphoetae]
MMNPLIFIIISSQIVFPQDTSPLRALYELCKISRKPCLSLGNQFDFCQQHSSTCLALADDSVENSTLRSPHEVFTKEQQLHRRLNPYSCDRKCDSEEEICRTICTSMMSSAPSCFSSCSYQHLTCLEGCVESRYFDRVLTNSTTKPPQPDVPTVCDNPECDTLKAICLGVCEHNTQCIASCETEHEECLTSPPSLSQDPAQHACTSKCLTDFALCRENQTECATRADDCLILCWKHPTNQSKEEIAIDECVSAYSSCADTCQNTTEPDVSPTLCVQRCFEQGEECFHAVTSSSTKTTPSQPSQVSEIGFDTSTLVEQQRARDLCEEQCVLEYIECTTDCSPKDELCFSSCLSLGETCHSSCSPNEQPTTPQPLTNRPISLKERRASSEPVFIVESGDICEAERNKCFGKCDATHDSDQNELRNCQKECNRALFTCRRDNPQPINTPLSAPKDDCDLVCQHALIECLSSNSTTFDEEGWIAHCRSTKAECVEQCRRSTDDVPCSEQCEVERKSCLETCQSIPCEMECRSTALNCKQNCSAPLSAQIEEKSGEGVCEEKCNEAYLDCSLECDDFAPCDTACRRTRRICLKDCSRAHVIIL